MILAEAFLVATAFAYLACLVYTLMGKSPLVGVSVLVQAVFYGVAFGLLGFVALNPLVSGLNLLLGVFYAFGAVGSFIGWPQVWSAFWREFPYRGSDAGQIGMAAWDLALSVCFFYLGFR